MNPDTKTSLLALEKELERLHSAVEHIEQAKTVAQKVIGAVGLIQKKYAEHLDALLEVQKDAVREAGSVQQERFDELGASARRHILESAARAKKYLEEYNAEVVTAIEAAGEAAGSSVRDVALKAGNVIQTAGEAAGGTVRDVALKAGNVIQTAGARMDELAGKSDRIISDSGERVGTLLENAGRQIEDKISGAGAQVQAQITSAGGQLHAQLQELLNRVREQLNALNDTAAKVIQESGTSTARRIEEITSKAAGVLGTLDERARHHVEEVGTLATTNLREVMMQAKNSIEDAGNQSKRIFAAIKKTQDQQTVEFEKVTVSADALIAASGKLVRTIDAVDFPTRLQSIESDIRNLHFNLNSAMTRLDALSTSNEQSMESLSNDLVAKIGRLEMFMEKGIRTHDDEMEKRLQVQEKQVAGMRVLLIVVLVLNLLMAAGMYMVWSGGEEPAAQPMELPTSPSDTLTMQDTAPAEPPVEEPVKKSTRRSSRKSSKEPEGTTRKR